jgi:hypothetical protein
VKSVKITKNVGKLSKNVENGLKLINTKKLKKKVQNKN